MATIPVRKSKPKRKPRKSKGSFHTEEHKVFGGRVKVFRTNQSGDVWQMRVWFRDSQKYFRKSLRTEYLQEALDKAEEIYLDLRSKEKNGYEIFEKTSKQLVDEYVNFRKGEVGDTITEERLGTIKSQMKWFLLFVNENAKITSIDPKKFREYKDWRRGHRPDVRLITLANEISTIRNFFNFCYESEYLPSRYKPLFPKVSKKNKGETVSRPELTMSEWRKIHTFMNGWHREAVSKKEIEQRKFILSFSVLLAASGLRFGEARRLRWRDLSVTSDGGVKALRIDVVDGKTGSRVIMARRPELIQSIKKISAHTGQNDFVFVDNDTGEPIKKDVYYKLWNYMLEQTGVCKEGKQIVYYSLRHFYATMRLYSKVDVFTLSKNMGCSVGFIEQHYGHVDVEMMAKDLVKNLDEEYMRGLLDR
jgi:integrase